MATYSSTSQPVQTSAFTALPDLMKSIIDREESAEINVDIVEKNRLSDDQGQEMMGVIRKIILRTITPRELLDTIRRDVKGLSDEQARKLALDLLGRRFLPMEWFIGNVENLIKELGGNLEIYQAEARKIYPEVYEIGATEKPAAKSVTTGSLVEHPILKEFDERLGTFKGKAEVLLRLTGLSSEVEQAVKDGKILPAEGDRLLKQLDGISYAVNTQDLNALEVESLKRGIRKVLRALNKS